MAQLQLYMCCNDVTCYYDTSKVKALRQMLICRIRIVTPDCLTQRLRKIQFTMDGCMHPHSQHIQYCLLYVVTVNCISNLDQLASSN